MKRSKRKVTRWLIIVAVVAALAIGVWYYVKNRPGLKSLFASGGNSPVVLEDYELNGDKVTLSLSKGKGTVNVELRQDGKTVGSSKATFASSMTLTTKAFGYLDVFVDNTDLGTIYVPFQIAGEWTVEKAKCVDETDVMNLQFELIDGRFVVTDLVGNAGFTNVEYWQGADFLGASIPAGHSVEPLIDHHITKKRWGNFPWFGTDNDGKDREMAQLTFKIVPKP